MHWPIGAPRLYEQTLPFTFKSFTADGLNEVQAGICQDIEPHLTESKDDRPVDIPRGTEESSQESSQEKLLRKGQRNPQRGGDQEPSQQEKHNTQQETNAQGLHQDLDRDFGQENDTIGVRFTRNGHLFATITAISLTIWQTKVTVLLFTARI